MQKKEGLRLEEIWTTLYCVNLFVFFPLFLRDGYLDIMEAKTAFFLVTTMVYISGVAVIFFIKKIQTGENIFLSENNIGFINICNVILFIIVLLGVLSNRLSTEVLWDSKGKLFGAVFLILCLVGSFCIARTFRMNQGVLWGAMIGSIFTSIFVICSRFNIDILHLYEVIVKSQRNVFLGTLGQINVVSSFFCICIPFWMGCYMYSRERTSRILFGIALVLALVAGFCSNSDSIFLGVAGTYLFYMWFSFTDFESASAYFQCAGFLFLSIVSVELFTYLAEMGAHFTVKWDALQSQFLSHSVLWFAMAVVLILCSVLVKRAEGRISLVKVRKPFFGTLAVVVILGIWIITVNHGRFSGIAAIQNYMVFDDSWGSNRGYVWKRTLRLLGQLPLRNKLIGCGMGMFPSFFDVYHADSMKQLGYYFVDAHNECLQFFVTTGLLGCISYFGMIIAEMIRNLSFIKKGKSNNELSVIVPAILFVWLLQGLVNSPTVFITPYLFLFLGIGQSIMTKEEKR